MHTALENSPHHFFPVRRFLSDVGLSQQMRYDKKYFMASKKDQTNTWHLQLIYMKEKQQQKLIENAT